MDHERHNQLRHSELCGRAAQPDAQWGVFGRFLGLRGEKPMILCNNIAVLHKKGTILCSRIVFLKKRP